MERTDRRSPTVTVLLPCYNGERFLRPAVQSILGQTYTDLELLAIDDGSRDATSRLLAEFAQQDSRVRLAPNDRNRGLIYTLNKGLALATGTFIARMDADDVALPTRLEEQMRVFESQPDTDIVASDVSYIGANDQHLFDPTPFRFNEATLRFLLFFVNPICHPTVTVRRDTFQRHGYATDAIHSEDYELWHRMARNGVKIRTVPRRLLRFRAAEGSVSHRHEAQLVNTFLRLSKDAIRTYFGFEIDPAVHRVVTNRMEHGMVRAADLRSAIEHLRQMRADYVSRERLVANDIALLDRFLDRHLATMLHRCYRRSAVDDSARGLALREAARLSLRSPLPIYMLAIEKARERFAR